MMMTGGGIPEVGVLITILGQAETETGTHTRIRTQTHTHAALKKHTSSTAVVQQLYMHTLLTK